MSFGDKLRLLFFGIIDESKLPEVVRIVHPQENCVPEKPVRPPLDNWDDDINTKEPEKLDIPFFDLGDDGVKSNF